MSASLLWAPKWKGHRFGSGSTLAVALEINGGERELSGEDVPFLMGLKAGNPAWIAEVNDLLDAIEKHVRIKVWAEY